ncbi:MAG: LysR family transcriptional regulator [Bacteroidota bacterium]
MINKNTYKIKGRIWIEINNETFIGGGKARLLRKIAELGSLRKAAAEMNLSYRQAWYSLNQMNKAGKEPLIILKRGGKHGGIAQITTFGKLILTQFKKIENDFDKFLDLHNNRFNF